MTPRKSGVTLHVPEGLYGIILGNVHEDFDAFKQCVKGNDCIVGPMCEFEFHSYYDILKGAWYKIDIPHIVKNPKVEDKIKVISRDRYQESIEYAQRLQEMEEPPDYENIYYRLNERNLEIFTHHFSQFIVYAESTTLDEVMGKDNILHFCSKHVELLIFTKWTQKDFCVKPLLEVCLQMCSLYHEETGYKQVYLP